jgi:hypothetical protein
VRLVTYGIMATPPDVRYLLDQQPHPEGSWDWFNVVAGTTLSGSEKAEILALIDNAGRAVSAIPVITIENNVVRALTAPFTTLFSAPFGCDEDAQTLGKLLGQRVGGKLRLDALDGTNSAVSAFKSGLASSGLVVARFKHFANWFEHIDNFADYWNSCGSTLKSTVKRKSAPLLRAGRLRFDQVDMSADWQRGAELYKGIYAKSWKPAEPYPNFMDTLLAKLGPRGTAKVGVATIDGLPIAVQIWLVRQPYATIFKLAHDPNFDRHSPGTLLTHWILGQLHEHEGVRDVDFGRGDDTYKRLWLCSSRDRHGILAANPRTCDGMIATLFDVLPTAVATYLHAKAEKSETAVSTRTSSSIRSGESKT